MPLLYHNHFTNMQLGIWHITEPLVFFDERNFVKPMGKSIDKYTQHVAGWHTVQWLSNQKVLPAYHAMGYPYDANGFFAISISHSKKYAAALVAHLTQYSNIGIDVEMYGEKAFILKHKFATETEWLVITHIIKNNLEAACIVWSIKEAIYKKMQERGIRFKDDITITTMQRVEDNYTFTYRFKNQHSIGYLWVFEDFCCSVCF
jgi:phosphopantetheinyl transferase